MKTQTILLVEDSPDDVFFMQRAFKAIGLEGTLQVAPDGQAALDYLHGAGAFSSREKYPLPCLILLDLKLPNVPGLDVLAAIRSTPILQMIPVIVLTSSRQDSDIDGAYSRGVSAYVVKASNSEERQEFVRSLADFWLRFNEPPRPCRR